MDNSIEIVKREEIKKIREKHDFVFSSRVMVLAIISLFPVFTFLFGLFGSIFYLIFYIGLIILALDIILFPFEKNRCLLIKILVLTGILGLVLVFTGIAGLVISNNSESNIFLTFWHKGGVQFLITIILASGIIHFYLKKILLCNYYVELIQSYDETYLIKQLEKGVNMSIWAKREELHWFKLYYSTDEKRLVSVASGNPLAVFPISEKAYRAPVFRRKYDSFVVVDMTPKHIEVIIEGNVRTKDKIAIEGKASVLAMIKDEDVFIKRVVNDPDQAEQKLRNSIIEAIQKTVPLCNLNQVGTVDEANKLIAEDTLSKHVDDDYCCFTVQKFTFLDITPKDKELAKSLDSEFREIVRHREKKVVADERAIDRKAEIKEEIKEAKHRTHIGILDGKMQNWMKTQGLVLGKKEREMQIETWKEIKILLESEAGKFAVFPEKQYDVKIEEIKLKLADKKELLKLYKMIYDSKQAALLGKYGGKIEMIEDGLAQQIGVNIRRGKIEDNFPAASEGEDVDEDEKKDEADSQKGDAEEDSNKTFKLNEEEAKSEENA